VDSRRPGRRGIDINAAVSAPNALNATFRIFGEILTCEAELLLHKLLDKREQNLLRQEPERGRNGFPGKIR